MTPAAASAATEVNSPASSSADSQVAVSTAEDARLATEVLGKLQAQYRYLDGVTVSVEPTPQGEQAIAYYADGRILISPTHGTSIESILAHEVWHVIDWRDNGKLDWGEKLPPVEAYSYLKQ